MAIQVFIQYDGHKDNAEVDYQDPGQVIGGGSRFDVLLMTGTSGRFSYKVYHDSALRKCLDTILTRIRAENFDKNNPPVIACTIHTEYVSEVPSTNAIPWESVGIRVPAVAQNRSLMITTAVHRAMEKMRETLPNPKS